MGYCVNIDLKNCVIPADKILDTFEALKSLYADGAAFSWVAGLSGSGYASLEHLLEDWRYSCEQLPDSSLKIVHFEGEKWGADDTLYEALAPFIQDGGTIIVSSEDGNQWGYRFNGGRIQNGRSRLVWE